MPLELTPRQWRALATVYHLYVANNRADGRTTAGGLTAFDGVSSGNVRGAGNKTADGVGCSGGDAADREAEKAVQWVEGVLPLLQRAFPEEMLAGVERRQEPDGSGARRRRRVERWQRLIPDALDAFLSDVLSPSASSSSSSSSSRGLTGPFLTANERTLLRLLNKEQQLADRCYQQHMALRDRVRREGQTLIRLAAEETNDKGHRSLGTETEKKWGDDGDERHATGHEQGSMERERKHERLCAVTTGRSLIKRERVTDLLDNEDTTGAMLLSATPDALGTDVASVSAANNITAMKTVTMNAKATTSLPVAAAIELTCAGCGEQGGELFQCRHCNLLRHEACDGPKAESDTGFCAICSHELGLSFSSGSLRSSTSTEERDELGEDDSSSLSGFVVHSSDVSEGSLTTSLSSSSSSSSSSSPSEAEKEERRVLLARAQQQKRQQQQQRKQKQQRCR
ncbi:hypothetical protein MOQ_006558 [Trypanosoma cruzi marinkellei]|uniref:Uncharacterized protein n=1 Tax=Trypanosoma cruzi marinkellei TaxID=85056 RepID=K2N4Q8_TRYCR|nr:hypothetical protein MOQ_006558 [Trypanosoma cruzi marinkellei]